MIASLFQDFGFIASLFVSYKCYDVCRFNKLKIKEIHSIIKAIFLYTLLYQAGTIRWISGNLPEEVGSVETLIWNIIDVLCFVTFFIILVFLKRIIIISQKITKKDASYEL